MCLPALAEEAPIDTIIFLALCDDLATNCTVNR